MIFFIVEVLYALDVRPPLVAIVALAALACDARPLAGPEAQAAFARARRELQAVPDGRIIFLNDHRLLPGQPLDDIDPRSITRIEVLKGAAAARLYGEEGRGGVVRIYTVEDVESAAP